MRFATSARIKAIVWTLMAVFLAALVSSAAILVWTLRQGELAESEARVSRFMSGAEAALNRSFLPIDVLLVSTEDMLGLSTTMGKRLDAGAASKLLRAAVRQNLMVGFVALLDDQGRVVASSDVTGDRPALQLPEGFLQEAMAPSVSTLVVSASVMNRASSERVLYLARHVTMAKSSRLLAVAEVPVGMLVSALTQGVDIAGLEVTLERSNGQVLVGVPEQKDAIARMPVGPLSALPIADHAWDVPARLSAVPALVVFSPTLYKDFWISASLPVDAALAGWKTKRNAIAIATLAFFLMVLAVAGFAVAYLNRMITARQAMERSKATLDQALESMVSGFLLLDVDRKVVQWNHRFEVMFPSLAGLLSTGMPFRQILEASVPRQLPDADEATRARWVERRLAVQRTFTGPYEEILPNGRYVQILERPTPEGGAVITFHDVTDLRQASAEIENLAFNDPLTGLPNRRLLLDRLGQATVLAQRSGQIGALLFVDLDQFKNLNDTLGHEVGDELLAQVAQRLKAAVRAADTVARLGGDEFVIVLNELSSCSDEAATLAQRIGEKILHSLTQPYTLKNHSHQSACSIGATLFGTVPQSAAELLRQADIAMYQVKAQRGKGICFFDPKMQVAINERAELDADLKEALAQGQFELHYQPQFTLGGAMVGAEALLRWQHPRRGMVAPTQFITAAEESDLIVPIGQWVLRTACEQLAAWKGQARFEHLHLSVNVSARQFRRPDFVQQVTSVVQQTGIRAHLLTLELTESLVLDSVDDAIAKMHELRMKGVRFSVDDFGTGYSSLAYLTRLPLHQLKIDRSFVRNLGVRPTDDVIVQTIIGMARNLELEAIAEGVETPAQKEFLARHGCDLYQGYLLGRPMPIAALEALLAEGGNQPALA